LKYLHKNGRYESSDLLKVSEYKALIDETTKVFDETIQNNIVPEPMAQKLKNDAFIFSGLKTHAQLLEASTLLMDKEGKVRSFEQFAISSSQSAANWAKINPEERYNLQYRTANDDRVRDNHRTLQDTTLPPDDPFWMLYYPPNGWRCRCTVVEVLKSKYEVSDPQKALEQGEKATTQIGANGKNKLEIFRFNPGAEQKLFPPKHPYNKVKGAEDIKKELEKDTSQYDNDLFKSFRQDAKEYAQSETHQKALQINNKIRPAETFCVDKYTGDFFVDINYYLRNGGEPKEEFFEKYRKVMNSALDKLESYKGTVYRGSDLSLEVINKYKKAAETGEPYTENYYLSTSKSEKKAFERNTIYEIKSKSGKQIEELSYFSYEKEVLFREGTQFKINAVYFDEKINRNVIEMEEI
jgi:hypothetical protein